MLLSPPARIQGMIAPWASERFRLGTISSGSNSSRVPSPVQVGQAPCGELNEKLRGSISPKLNPQCDAGELLGEAHLPRHR